MGRMRSDELVRKMERIIRERGLFRDGDRIVAAVSGGADSVALLHMLLALAPEKGYRVAAAHVNHGLRGAESDADESYVRELAERLGAECFVARVDVRAALPKYGNNKQSAARALRLEALGKFARSWRADAVALAHHADDQAETVLMRLLRGTGPGGLGGIRFLSHVNGMKLVRPLLRISKEELESYCSRHGLAPRFDSSNASRDYFRNRIRLDVMPYIMKQCGGASDALRRTAELAADEDDLLEELARGRLAEMADGNGEIVRIDRELFLACHIALQRRMIKIILRSLIPDDDAIDSAKIERIRIAAAAERPTTTEIRVGADVVFRRVYDRLEWAPYRNEAPQPYAMRIDVTA